jgi:hypothetical protein
MESNILYTEMIEEYILDRMDSGQKAAFEQLLTKDPLVKQEFEVQKDIIQSIQNTRKAELKARLNKIEVSSGSGWSNASKVAASLLLVSSIGVGTYFLYNQDNTQIPNPVETNQEIVVSENKEKQIDKTIYIEKQAEKIPTISSNTKVAEETKIKPVKKEKPIASSPEVTVQVNIPQISESFSGSDNIEKSISLPNSEVTKAIDTKAKLDVSLVEDAGEIGYQYFNNKLFLFGEFSAGKYEVLELNNARKKEMYLYFKNEYYYLNPNTFDKTQLKNIKNQEIINQLDLIRKK